MKKFRTKILKIDSPGGKMRLLVLSPDYADVSPSPGVLWIHGGGYIAGMKEMVHMSRVDMWGMLLEVCDILRLASLTVYDEYKLQK